MAIDGLIMPAPSMAKIMLNYTFLGDFNLHRATLPRPLISVGFQGWQP